MSVLADYETLGPFGTRLAWLALTIPAVLCGVIGLAAAARHPPRARTAIVLGAIACVFELVAVSMLYASYLEERSYLDRIARSVVEQPAFRGDPAQEYEQFGARNRYTFGAIVWFTSAVTLAIGMSAIGTAVMRRNAKKSPPTPL